MYFLRVEIPGAPWHEVPKDVYKLAEHRWSSSRDGADGSWFEGNGVAGHTTHQSRPFTERDIIEGYNA